MSARFSLLTIPAILLLLLFAIPLTPHAAPLAWQGPIPPIDIGYGQWGDHGVSPATTFTFESQGHDNYLTLYFPGDQTAAAATIFFAPGWNISCESYGELLRFLASKGYVSVCDDYYEDSGIIGDQLYESFKEAARRYPTKIDVSKFGLAGHSSGAGLLPSVGYRLAVGDGWGARGKFIFSSAPWIDFDITDAMLADYPSDMKFILQTYEEDATTDLRTYIDQFESLDRIPDSEKDYLILRPATIDGYTYHADHPTIATGGDGYGVYDAMDAYGVFRLIDALADYTFTGNLTAKAIALEQNHDADRQSEMGDLPDLISTDDPRPIPGLVTDYPCDTADNPRRDHCDDYDNKLPTAVPLWPIRHALISQTAPTFTWEPVPTAVRYDLIIRPMLATGEPDWNTSYGEDDISAGDAGCDAGDDCTYTLVNNLPAGDYVWWVKGYDAGGKESVWPRRNFFTRVDYHFYFPDIRARVLNPDDLRFDWEHEPAYARYEVWRDTAPYFTPAGEPLKAITATPWWFPDLYRLGDPAVNHFYVIRGVESNGESVDKRMGEFDFQLTPGADANAPAHVYPPDTTYTPIFTDTPAMPDYLATLVDTTTDTAIQRITRPDTEHYTSGYPTHSYAKNQPWNADMTLYKFYSVAVYDEQTHDMVLELPGNLYETFWSNTNPDLLYSFREGGDIKTFSISTQQETLLYHLDGYDRVKLGPGEGNIDKNDHYVALVGKRGVDLDVIVFDLRASTVITTVAFAGAWGDTDDMPEHLDWASISQSGDYVVMNWDSGPPWDVQPWNGHYGIEVYNRDMTFHHRAARYGNHGDLCFAPDGRELYVQFWGDQGTINAYPLDDTAEDSPIIIHDHPDFGVGDAHLSCRNLLRPGWAYVSVDPDRGGMALAVKLDGSQTIEYFGHHFSSAASYKKSPMPVPNPWGDVVMFKSDFGDDSNPDEAYDFEARYAPEAATRTATNAAP